MGEIYYYKTGAACPGAATTKSNKIILSMETRKNIEIKILLSLILIDLLAKNNELVMAFTKLYPKDPTPLINQIINCQLN